jgi:hypothetical protein
VALQIHDMLLLLLTNVHPAFIIAELPHWLSLKEKRKKILQNVVHLRPQGKLQ